MYQLKIGCIGLFNNSKDLLNNYKLNKENHNYICPELLLESSEFNSKIDIWSLGCIMYELLTLRKAFQADEFEALNDLIINETVDFSGMKINPSSLMISILIEK
jgi:NIMA (never in mitosis gene a)-related kinase